MKGGHVGKAHSWRELKAMSDRELIEEHDKITNIIGEYLVTIREELRHRERTKQTRVMLWMTGVITAATILNVILWAID